MLKKKFFSAVDRNLFVEPASLAAIREGFRGGAHLVAIRILEPKSDS